jgi:hypothetical protein
MRRRGKRGCVLRKQVKKRLQALALIQNPLIPESRKQLPCIEMPVFCSL